MPLFRYELASVLSWRPLWAGVRSVEEDLGNNACDFNFDVADGDEDDNTQGADEDRYEHDVADGDGAEHVPNEPNPRTMV